MRIAVTYDNGQIFQHFGHTQTFKLYDVEDGQVTAMYLADTGSTGHGALAGLLNGIGADVLICGGIGGGARNALADAGVTLYGGVSGDADDAVAAFLNESLNYNPDVQCNHHSHAEGESCGSHGAGHSCGGHEGHSCGNHGCH
ncbi:MAG: NifB/NifX family molybdenum-iron cluster-binding protein [Eubacteriaceae bacterium]